MKTMTRKYSMATALGAITLASILAGCGGGGSGTGNGIVAPLLETSNLQGIWGTGTVGGEQASMVVLASGASWLLVNNSPVSMITTMLKGTDSGYTGSGYEYTSGSTAAPATVSFAVKATPKSALSGTITSGTVAKDFSFKYESRYEQAASLPDVAHTWYGTKNASTIQFTWTVAFDGALSGTSTAGCSYTGSNVKVHADGFVSVGVFDLMLKETCAGIVKDFAGIATLSADKSVAVFAFSNAAGDEGDFLRMEKNPFVQ
jgi:hypothetical protein